MKISRIEVQKKNKKRSSIFIDGEFRCGLTNEIVIKYGLKEGDEITEAEIKNLLLAEEKERLKQRVFRMLRYQNRSIAEMKDRLLRLGYEPDIVETVVNELVEEGFLDDRRFVHQFVNDFTELKPKGNIFIRNELRKKKVAPELIEEVTNTRSEREIILKLLETKLRGFDRKNPKERAKIVRRLLSRGFTPSGIYEVLGEE